MQQIPLVNLKAQYATIKPELDAAMQAVIDDSAFIGGKAVKEFEKDFAAFCGVAHGVGVSNGTDALYLTLKALSVGAEDEVITVAHSFIATASAVLHTGATVRFVDVHPETLLMDISQVESALTHRTKVLLPVHLYGMPCDMASLQMISAQHGLVLLEDVAQAHGARYGDKVAGSFGIAGCFSFYPGKVLGAFGDAGAIVTNDAELAVKLRRLRDHGRESKYEHLELGYNHRMDALQAAVLRVKLQHLRRWIERRRQIAARYREALQWLAGVTLLQERPGAQGVYHQFVVQVEAREVVREALRNRGIATGVHYPLPLHLQPALRDLGYRRGDLPVTETAAERVLSLPIYPEMTDSMVDYVIEQLEKSLV